MGDYDNYVDYDAILSFDAPRVTYDTDLPEPDIYRDYDYDIDNAGVPYKTKFSEPTSWLDKIIAAGKGALPDVLKSLLEKGGAFAKENPMLTGGLGGAALMALLSSMGNKQQQAPQYVGLGASGPAPAAAPTQFVQLPSQAQSYQSMMGYADGGVVHMRSGDFVFSKKAMDKVGGIEGLKKRGYPAKKIVGPGTGTSDSIPATIDGKPVARVANGEALIPGGASMKGLAGLHTRMRKGK